MNHEREHAHADHALVQRRADLDVAPGASSRSAQLDAPTHPITSGLIQRKARDANGVAADAESAVASASASSGFALPAPLMRKFESSLGADLSGVRVHTGADSAAAASAVGAKAYTAGQDIHFGAGHYDPVERLRPAPPRPRSRSHRPASRRRRLGPPEQARSQLARRLPRARSRPRRGRDGERRHGLDISTYLPACARSLFREQGTGRSKAGRSTRSTRSSRKHARTPTEGIHDST